MLEVEVGQDGADAPVLLAARRQAELGEDAVEVLSTVASVMNSAAEMAALDRPSAS
jgi:hypothetical protein